MSRIFSTYKSTHKTLRVYEASEVANMVQVLDKARGSLMLEKGPQNLRETGRDFVSKGPITAVYNGVERVWGTMGQRIDNLLGTHLSSGGPLR